MATPSQVVLVLSLLLAPFLTQLKAGAAPNGARAPLYIGQMVPYMQLAIGTPPRNITAMLDTGSTLVWTQCKPCQKCFNQPQPIFDPASSSTFSRHPCVSPRCYDLQAHAQCMPGDNCTYTYSYGNGNPAAMTTGTLSTETLTIGGVAFPDVSFGCSDDSGDAYTAGCGIAGFARDPLSLPSQLGLKKFSYCVPLISKQKPGIVFLGSEAVLKGSEIQTIPFITNPKRTPLYYLPWIAITVGNTLLPIPKNAIEINARTGTGGLFIDSGGNTVLDEQVFRIVEEAFLSQVKLPRAQGGPMPLCFSIPKGASLESLGLPRMVLHFQGGDDWDLPLNNYMTVWGEAVCLWVMRGPQGKSVLGMTQHYGTHVLYDLEKSTLSFVTNSC